MLNPSYDASDAFELAKGIVDDYEKAEGLSDPALRILNLARRYCELYEKQQTRLAEDTGGS